MHISTPRLLPAHRLPILPCALCLRSSRGYMLRMENKVRFSISVIWKIERTSPPRLRMPPPAVLSGAWRFHLVLCILIVNSLSLHALSTTLCYRWHGASPYPSCPCWLTCVIFACLWACGELAFGLTWLFMRLPSFPYYPHFSFMVCLGMIAVPMAGLLRGELRRLRRARGSPLLAHLHLRCSFCHLLCRRQRGGYCLAGGCCSAASAEELEPHLVHAFGAGMMASRASFLAWRDGDAWAYAA